MTALSEGDLVGTWRLRSWEAVADDGTIARPFGDRPIGYLMYTSDLHMITTISEADRNPIGGDVLLAPPEAQADAFGSFMAYAGPFRVTEGDVIHSVEMSLYPDWIGTEQRRHVRLDVSGHRLTLSTDPIPVSGVLMRHHLDWERLVG